MKRKGTLDVGGYLKWYQKFVDEQGAPQYIGKPEYTVNPITVKAIDYDPDEGDEYLLETADGKVNAYVPSRFVTLRCHIPARKLR